MDNKAQHIVPRSYLSQFTDPSTPEGQEPYVWVFERGRADPYRRAPKKLAIRSYYYTHFDEAGIRNDAVDQFLQQLENAGIPILKRLDQGESPSSLSDSEREEFAYFLALVSLRVPRFRESVERFALDVVRKSAQVAAAHPEFFQHLLEQAANDKGEPKPTPEVVAELRGAMLKGELGVEIDPVVSLQAMVDQAPQIAEYVYTCEWRVLTAPETTGFVTGDCPLVKVTTQRPWSSWYSGVGWATPYMEATFPLSPRKCLLMSLHHPEGIEEVSSMRVTEANLRTAAHAKHEVYSSAAIDPTSLNKPTGWNWWSPLSDVLDLTGLDEAGADTGAI